MAFSSGQKKIFGPIPPC